MTLQGANPRFRFWENLEIAKCQAAIEAAWTGCAVMRVEAAEMQARAIIFFGTVPAATITHAGEARVVSPTVCSFHSSREAFLSSPEIFGFLVLRHPIEVPSYGTHDPQFSRIAVRSSHAFTPIRVGYMGPVFCQECKQPISEKRLIAIPKAKRCTACQSNKEQNLYAIP